jgi:hypothetical protein
MREDTDAEGVFPKRTFRAMLVSMPSEQRAPQRDYLAPLRSACALVTCGDGPMRTIGTGYFVAANTVVTCEHVVRGAKADGTVALTLFDGSRHEARVERMEADTDVALLRLPQDVPSITPLKLVEGTERGRAFSVMGFPQMMRGVQLLLTGQVHDPVGRDRRGASAIVLFSDMVAAGQGALMKGYSGSPVVVDGAVVGHLGRVLVDNEGERPSAEMGLVFATPGREVLRFWRGEAPSSVASGPAQPPGAAYSEEWYCPRPDCERRALAYLEGPGHPAVLYGPRQSGKSWLLRHLVDAWRQQWPQGAVARVNLLEFDEPETLEALTEQLAYALVDELDGDDTWLDTYKRGKAAPMIRLGTMLKRHVLDRGHPTLLALDSTDAILGRPYASSFFLGLRSWMEKNSEPWTQLRLLMAISTTPSRMVSDLNGSPFNLSIPVTLPSLPSSDIQRLAVRHGLHLTAHELESLEKLTGGHPYLVRRALFEAMLASGDRGKLVLNPPAEVFIAHLRSLLHFIKRESLVEVLKAVLRNPTVRVSPDQEDLLTKAWLVRRTNANTLEWTCQLHRDYFSQVLLESAAR